VNGSVEAIKDDCLRLLARREHSRKELQQKLTAKGYPQDPVSAVIEELAAEGWQNDLRYAENYTRSRIRKGYGPLRIAYELQQNGVNIACKPDGAPASFDIEAIVQEEAGNWIALMEQVYHKKFGSGQRLEFKEWAKRNRFLMQRGFPGPLISALIEHLNIIVI
jgi:regulatory protein